MLAYFKSVRKRKVAILKEGGRISLKTRKLLSSFFRWWWWLEGVATGCWWCGSVGQS